MKFQKKICGGGGFGQGGCERKISFCENSKKLGGGGGGGGGVGGGCERRIKVFVNIQKKIYIVGFGGGGGGGGGGGRGLDLWVRKTCSLIH